MGQRPVPAVALTATDRFAEPPFDDRLGSARQLVVLGSGVTALAVARSGHALGLTPVVVDTEAGIATASRLVRAHIATGSQREELLDALAAEGQGGMAYLISTTDAWLRVIATHRSHLQSAYARILHPEADALAVCLSKSRFARWCEDNSLLAPRTYAVGEGFQLESTPERFPLLLRPAETLHSAPSVKLPKAVQASSMEELERILRDFRAAGVVPVVAESLLGRRLTQYSVGLGRTGGKTLCVVARKLRPGPEACSLGTLVETAEQPEVEQLARRAVDLLDYEGIAEVEVLRDEDSGENFLIEINARPWMQMALAPAAGRDLLQFVLTGSTASALANRATKSVRWLAFHADLYVCFNWENGLVRTGALPLGQYLRSLVNANAYALWSIHDPRPFWHDLSHLVCSRLNRARPE